MNSNQCFALLIVISILLASTPVDAVVGPAAALVSPAAVLPLLKTKKAILVAPIVLPLAAGAKAAKLAAGAVAIAVPAGVGAAVGAPLGAIIGAKAGAIKGAALGKALLGAKVALASNAAVAGAALASKPIVLVLGAKAKAASAGVAIVAKAKATAGQALALAGQKLNDVSLQVQAAGASIGEQLSAHLNSIPKFPVSLASGIDVPTIPLETLLRLLNGPHLLESTIRVNTPAIGEKVTKAVITSNRRKRQANFRQGRRQGSSASTGGANSGQLNQLISYVQQNRLQGCLARIICELSANPSLHGPDGVRFGASLLALGRVPHPETSQYRSASNVGTQMRKPEECVKRFADCNLQSPDIIRLGNSMLRN